MSKATKTNKIGLTKQDYKGGPSTLCPGCGHNAISNHIMTACYESGVDPLKLGKFSGIGCSSKTPAYFISKAHAFNTVHGRMPSITTGALVANTQLTGLSVSGDGDTASIGMGQFVHVIRRNLPMVYIIENNGVYGLTKGQFSATADLGSKLKHGAVNPYEAIDLCALAIQLDCGFVARSFSGDKKQVVPLIQAALAHKGTCIIDIISPCVTFNDHKGSTKSYDYAKEFDVPLHELDYIDSAEEIDVDYEGSTEVELHDGSRLALKKIDKDYDHTSKVGALTAIEAAKDEGQFLTGLLFHNKDKVPFYDILKLPEAPLKDFQAEDLRMSREDFKGLMDSFL